MTSGKGLLNERPMRDSISRAFENLIAMAAQDQRDALIAVYQGAVSTRRGTSLKRSISSGEIREFHQQLKNWRIRGGSILSQARRIRDRRCESIEILLELMDLIIPRGKTTRSPSVGAKSSLGSLIRQVRNSGWSVDRGQKKLSIATELVDEHFIPMFNREKLRHLDDQERDRLIRQTLMFLKRE